LLESIFECVVGCTCCRNVGVRYRKLAREGDDDEEEFVFSSDEEDEEEKDDDDDDDDDDENNIPLRRFPSANLRKPFND
jgi:hypothetical protein